MDSIENLCKAVDEQQRAANGQFGSGGGGGEGSQASASKPPSAQEKKRAERKVATRKTAAEKAKEFYEANKEVINNVGGKPISGMSKQEAHEEVKKLDAQWNKWMSGEGVSGSKKDQEKAEKVMAHQRGLLMQKIHHG